MNSTQKKIIFLTGDIVLLYFSLFCTLWLRYGFAEQWNEHLFPFSVIFSFLLLIFYIDGLYDFSFAKNKTDVVNKLGVSFFIAAAIAAIFFYLGHERLFSIRPQRVLLVDFGLAFSFVFLWRVALLRFMRSPKFATPTLLIGSSPLAREVIAKLSRSPELGFRLKAVLTTGEGFLTDPNIVAFIDPNKLEEICKNAQIQTIIFDEGAKQDPVLLQGLLACLPLTITFYELSNFYEKITGKIPVDHIRHTWFLENLNQGSKKLYEFSKRLVDVVLSIVILTLTLPLLPFIAIAIKAHDRGSVLFKQIRVGRNNKNFLAMKFRTMVVNAEAAGPQWAQPADPRITPFGTFMRKTRIDEIPQLWNVLKGEMTLIGPRPERPEFVAELKKHIPFYEERLLVKPGLTGWAQVMGPAYGGSVEETLEKIQYDLYYIKNRSLGLDISILLKTVKTVLSRSGQ